ncbi:MAG: DUF1294 domain-containing protein [Bacillota bacterium]|jgi:uncharacterized membrane protein YsdA (DUF1294 family)|nr:DUF1294 domain-containing protein [Candidatus Fermentithermobacillaceae bacterium]
MHITHLTAVCSQAGGPLHPVQLLVWFLAAYNVLACILMGYDKLQAIRGGRRIPERTLFALALTGGSLGILAGMLSFRHKTRHLNFRLRVPAMLLLQIWLLYRYL